MKNKNEIENIDVLVTDLSRRRSVASNEKNEANKKYDEIEKLINADEKLLNFGVDYTLVEEIAPKLVETLLKEGKFDGKYENRVMAVDIDPTRKIVAYLTMDESTVHDDDYREYPRRNLNLSVFKDGECIVGKNYVARGCFINHVGYVGPGDYHHSPENDFGTVELLETDDENILQIKLTSEIYGFEDKPRYGKILTFNLEKNEITEVENLDTVKYESLKY